MHAAARRSFIHSLILFYPMKTAQENHRLVLRSFLRFLLLFLFLFLLFFFFFSSSSSFQPNLIAKFPSPPFSSYPSSGLRIRPGFSSYDDYIKLQLKKTLNPKLRRIWTTRDWDRKVLVFSRFFQRLKSHNLLANTSKALCVGARVGQEVLALKLVGVNDSVGIDLVPYPPLVLHGDFHAQPFHNATFDFEFSNVFDHALYPSRFVSEIERTLKPGGVCVLHVALVRRGDRYSANDLYDVEPLVGLFKQSEVVHVRRVDGFGLDTELAYGRTYQEKKLEQPSKKIGMLDRATAN
ncbi:hypothetical protein ACLOJK_009256 [Asimina triloba]